MNLNYELVTKLIFIVYSISLLFLSCYGIIQLHLVYQYLKYKKQKPQNLPEPLTSYPFVTVQLPVYNDSLVVERLIDAVAKFDYPKGKWEIQILDDSTDETSSIITNKIQELCESGLQIHHIQRKKRTGYKAGALQNGLLTAKGKFIAIFDSDFIPSRDFLQQTIPYFHNEKTGMVQTRWTHLNKNNSLLTHFQAFLLDAHFSIEQKGRNNAGYFINFSGTGGVWRKDCMLDAGGWHTDTLTEDFDLSYRAQIRGWQFLYLENVTVPAELPPVMSALQAQQFRWIKGNAETAKKHVKMILRSPIIPFYKGQRVLSFDGWIGVYQRVPGFFSQRSFVNIKATRSAVESLVSLCFLFINQLALPGCVSLYINRFYRLCKQRCKAIFL